MDFGCLVTKNKQFEYITLSLCKRKCKRRRKIKTEESEIKVNRCWNSDKLVERWWFAISLGLWKRLPVFPVGCRQQLGPLNSSQLYGTNRTPSVPTPSMQPLSPHWRQNAKYASLPSQSLPKDSSAVLCSTYIVPLYTFKMRDGDMLKGKEQTGLMQL